jgi:hypothetical protein
MARSDSRHFCGRFCGKNGFFYSFNAYKHLAFIHCISDRRSACQAEFAKALRINPQLELSAAEAGHPSWGPVFAREKAKQKATPKSSGNKPIPGK